MGSQPETGPVVRDTSLDKGTKMESSKASKVLKGEKVQYLLTDSWADSGRERESLSLHLCGNLNYFYGAFLPGFLWPIIVNLPCSQSLFDISQDPSLCAQASLSQDGF